MGDAANYNLPPPKSMCLRGNLAQNWTEWKESYNHWAIATKLSKESKLIQVSTLYTVMGPETVNIAKNITIADRNDSKSVMEGLTAYFEPQKNETFERYMFNSAIQGEDTIDSFLVRLRKLSNSCGFGELQDSLIKDRLVIGINDVSTRKRLLRERNLTLDLALSVCRAAEQAGIHLKQFDEEVEQVHKITKKRSEQSTKQHSKIVNCRYCGGNHARRECPAYGQVCSICSKKNHFSKVCKATRKVHSVSNTNNEFQLLGDESDDSDNNCEVYTVSEKNVDVHKSKYMILPEIKLNGDLKWKQVTMQIDNGSAVNCIKYKDLLKLNKDFQSKPTATKLKAYSGNDISTLGTVKLVVKINNCEEVLTFYIVENVSVNLLSGESSEKLGLISFNREQLVNNLTANPLTKEDVLSKYGDVFKGLGNIGTYQIELGSNAKPHQDAPRSAPIAVKNAIKQRLEELVHQEILVKESEPTDWVNSAVYVNKAGKKLRICLDPKELNKHIKIPKYKMPTIEEVTPSLSKAKVFTICDAKDGFLQVKLDNESSKYTTFHTPFGRYRWVRLPFGIASAPEEFQRRTLEIIEGLKGVFVIADDCLIVGEGDTVAEAIQNHDQNLQAFLDRCREKQFKLNKDKFRFRLSEVKYHGHVLTASGVKPDPEKVTAITNMPRPKDKTEIKRLLGMITYLGKFIPNLSEIAEPLRNLTKENVTYIWSDYHDKSFKNLKEIITNSPCLQYYDVEEEVSIETDASDYGLGAVITQKGHPIAYASRTLSQTERRYSQIEKECLALVFGCQRFDQYLFGRNQITAYTDHKPLESILRKPINSAPKRLQRMMLRLQRYHLNVIYKKGTKMFISDHLSRQPMAALARGEGRSEELNYDIFNLHAENTLMREIENIDPNVYHNVSDATLLRIAKATENDDELLKLKAHIVAGFPHDKNQLEENIKIYWSYRDELSIENGVLYRGTRVIVPKIEQKNILSQIHASHLGTSTTLNKVKDNLYWPTISKDISHLCETCTRCQTNKPSNAKPAMQSQPIPKRRWQICSSDIFTHQNENYLVVVDNLTKFWEVEKLNDMSAFEIIDKMKSIFARCGIPELLISDNGPQYTSNEFYKFIKQWRIHHYTSSPYHSAGNGSAEAAVKVIKNLLKKSNDFHMAVLEHRNTPDTSGYSASQKLNSRRLRTTLPIKPKLLSPEIIPVEEIIVHTVKKKRENKQYYDKRNRNSLPQLSVGDNVRVQLKPKSCKEWSLAKVNDIVNEKSCMLNSQGKNYRRNRLHIRTSREKYSAENLDVDTNEYETEKENVKDSLTNTDQISSPKESGKTNTDQISSPRESGKTKSGRQVLVPARFNDYVLNKS